MAEEMEVKMIIELPFELGQTIYQIEENDLVKHKIEEIRISKRYWQIITNKRHVVINESLDKIYFFKRKDAVKFLKERMIEKDGYEKRD